MSASQLSTYAITVLLQATVHFSSTVCVCVQQMYSSLVYNYTCKHF